VRHAPNDGVLSSLFNKGRLGVGNVLLVFDNRRLADREAFSLAPRDDRRNGLVPDEALVDLGLQGTITNPAVPTLAVPGHADRHLGVSAAHRKPTLGHRLDSTSPNEAIQPFTGRRERNVLVVDARA